jgi:hypothetical protein
MLLDASPDCSRTFCVRQVDRLKKSAYLKSHTSDMLNLVDDIFRDVPGSLREFPG